MRKIELKEVQQLEFEILRYVAKFCDENDIKYYLGYGALIGAIRHKGFIPWDDDIDILMPRVDYEKFINLFKSNNKFDIVNFNLNKHCLYFHTLVMNNKTLIKPRGASEGCDYGGVYIDIDPIDNIPNDVKIYHRQYKRIKFYKNIFYVKLLKKRKGRALYKEIILFLGRNTFKFINLNRLAKLIDNISKKYSSIKSDYVACVFGPYGKKERMHREIFEETIEVEFEGELFKAPKGYHEYLTNLYGDYMTPVPPPENQESYHNFKAYWKD